MAGWKNQILIHHRYDEIYSERMLKNLLALSTIFLRQIISNLRLLINSNAYKENEEI